MSKTLHIMDFVLDANVMKYSLYNTTENKNVRYKPCIGLTPTSLFRILLAWLFSRSCQIYFGNIHQRPIFIYMRYK